MQFPPPLRQIVYGWMSRAFLFISNLCIPVNAFLIVLGWAFMAITIGFGYLTSTTLKGIWMFFDRNGALIDRILTLPTAADRCTHCTVRDNDDYFILKPSYWSLQPDNGYVCFQNTRNSILIYGLTLIFLRSHQYLLISTVYEAPKSQRGGALHKVQFLRGGGV